MKLITSEDIILDLSRDYKINQSGWEADAIRHIGRCLEILRIPVSMVQSTVALKIKDFRVALPCSLENLISIKNQNGEKLYLTNSGEFNNIVANSNGVIVHTNDTETLLKYGYKINDNYIQTAITDQCLIITFDSFPVKKGLDGKYYPMIPDGGLTKEAITWWVVYKFAISGIIRSISPQDAKALYDTYEQSARNEWHFRTEDERLQFARMWVRNISDLNLADRYFDSDIVQEEI